MPDIIAGRLHSSFLSQGNAISLAKEGKLRALAVLLDRRSPLLPEVPTIAEAGAPAVTVRQWAGVFGPPKLPRDIVERLNKEVNAALKRPDVLEQLQRYGYAAEGSTPEGLTAINREDLALWRKLVAEAAIALLLPAGRLADASDKAMLYKVGMVTFALSSLLVGLVSSVPAILCLRFVQGITSAAVQAAGPAIIADAVPPERRGRAYGITIGAIYAGLTLRPICAGFLVDLWGWRAVFLAGGALVLVLLIPIHFMLPASWRRPPKGAVHLPSALLAVAAMLVLVGGAATLRQGAIGYGAMALGLALLAAFVLWQGRVAQPLLNVDLLMKNLVLPGALRVQWLLYCNAFGSRFKPDPSMQTVLGHSANTAGQVLAIGTLLMAAVAPVAGILSDRYRAALIASCGVALALIAAPAALR